MLLAIAPNQSKHTGQRWNELSDSYLKGTTCLGLLYRSGTETDALYGYSDSDWGGDCNDYKSTTGYLFLLGGTAVTWKSKKQSCVALSTAEAEYMALSSAAQEAIWMRELNSDLGNPQSQPTLVYEDNQSAIAMTKNPQFHGRTKHINIKYHYVREQVSKDKICLEYCPTEDMLADALTKGIGPEKFEKLRSLYGMYNPVSIEKECRNWALSTVCTCSELPGLHVLIFVQLAQFITEFGFFMTMRFVSLEWNFECMLLN